MSLRIFVYVEDGEVEVNHLIYQQFWTDEPKQNPRDSPGDDDNEVHNVPAVPQVWPLVADEAEG